MTKSLDKRHAAAHAIGQRALGIFHALAEDLRRSADEHRQVAAEAHQQAVALADLRDSAYDAAQDAERQAAAIKSLVS